MEVKLFSIGERKPDYSAPARESPSGIRPEVGLNRREPYRGRTHYPAVISSEARNLGEAG